MTDVRVMGNNLDGFGVDNFGVDNFGVDNFGVIEEFATTARTLGTSLNSAAAATAAGAALSVATFGIIGADFAAAFTNAQLQFCGAIGQLGGLFDDVGAAAQASASSYADGDGSAATRITGAGL